MQRRYMIAEGRSFCGDTGMSPGKTQVPDLVWNNLLNRAAATLCGMFNVIYTNYAANVVSGQSAYCDPNILEITAVSIFWADGTRHTMTPVKIQAMDDQFPQWRDQPSSPNPINFIPLGLTGFTLYPAPNYSYAGGIAIEGFGTSDTSMGLTNSWGAPESECPLPLMMHQAVIYEAVKLRASRHPPMPDVINMVTPLLNEQLHIIESRMKNITTANRFPAYTTGGGMSASPYGDPLEIGGW